MVCGVLFMVLLFVFAGWAIATIVCVCVGVVVGVAAVVVYLFVGLRR